MLKHHYLNNKKNNILTQKEEDKNKNKTLNTQKEEDKNKNKTFNTNIIIKTKTDKFNFKLR